MLTAKESQIVRAAWEMGRIGWESARRIIQAPTRDAEKHAMQSLLNKRDEQGRTYIERQGALYVIGDIVEDFVSIDADCEDQIPPEVEFADVDVGNCFTSERLSLDRGTCDACHKPNRLISKEYAYINGEYHHVLSFCFDCRGSIQ